MFTPAVPANDVQFQECRIVNVDRSPADRHHGSVQLHRREQRRSLTAQTLAPGEAGGFSLSGIYGTKLLQIHRERKSDRYARIHRYPGMWNGRGPEPDRRFGRRLLASGKLLRQRPGDSLDLVRGGNWGRSRSEATRQRKPSGASGAAWNWCHVMGGTYTRSCVSIA
jgi:hypothetical protein